MLKEVNRSPCTPLPTLHRQLLLVSLTVGKCYLPVERTESKRRQSISHVTGR